MVNRKILTPEASRQAAFGARVRSSREARGWTQQDLATRLECSAALISHVETGRKMPTLRFSRSLDVVFGQVGVVDTFEQQYREIKYGVLLEGFPEYLAHEGRAAEIRLFESGLIPGPLQTRAYAQALADSAVRRGTVTREQADRRVQVLLDRQAALVRPLPPIMIVVLDESCIRRPIGGEAVMDEQLARLTAFAELPHVVFHIAPFDIGERRPFDRLVNLLTLPDRSVMSYVESQTQGYLDREPNSVLPLVRAYHQLQATSLSEADSVGMIHQLRRGTP
ncbi:Scr1 family TA system antitoxin-like transcriptional regulator [Streptomyces sp. NPDC094448]|uniref:helix-turn-helix domain-containing protein n=1 Tax=Streptomyces sp. NPDC094448 TaxID=3366063 RepID=UPI00380777CE